MQHAEAVLTAIEQIGAVAIIRRTVPFDAPAIARALHAAGAHILEITLNSHNALRTIEAVSALEIPGMLIGAGTVRTAAMAHDAIAAGALFLVAPNFDPAAVEAAHAASIPMIPGIATPSEAVAATEAGCRLLKFFPAAALGARYLRLMRDPLDDVKFMATGGIDRNNLLEFFAAGAVAVGLGSSLTGHPNDSPETLWERATACLDEIARVRGGAPSASPAQT